MIHTPVGHFSVPSSWRFSKKSFSDFFQNVLVLIRFIDKFFNVILSQCYFIRYDGVAPIHCAVRRGDAGLACLKRLIADPRCDLDVLDSDGESRNDAMQCNFTEIFQEFSSSLSHTLTKVVAQTSYSSLFGMFKWRTTRIIHRSTCIV